MRRVSILMALVLLALAATASQHIVTGSSASITVALGGFIDPDGK
jgi:hypothetical protein